MCGVDEKYTPSPLVGRRQPPTTTLFVQGEDADEAFYFLLLFFHLLVLLRSLPFNLSFGSISGVSQSQTPQFSARSKCSGSGPFVEIQYLPKGRCDFR